MVSATGFGELANTGKIPIKEISYGLRNPFTHPHYLPQVPSFSREHNLGNTACWDAIDDA